MSRVNIWFPFYIGDYKAETQGLSLEERGIFIELLCNYFHKQSPLPDDDKKLSRLAGVSPYKWRKARQSIAPIFTINKGLWTLPRLDEQIAHGMEIRKQRQESGRKGGRISAAKRQANATANASLKSKQVVYKSQSQSYLSNCIPPIEGDIEDSDSTLEASAPGVSHV